MNQQLNLNTALIAIVLALSGWTLKKVSDLAESQAALKVQVQNLERIVYAKGDQ
jgi:hypothetical protein